eukprot:TRINITY_DN19966_c0_g1_i3.p1 TRINITY_DN19966_c0_g1~~TRINITY_DN19966_c0_g1_i3.p1  ORF type:complete len:444 (+),score=73.37 TRINITY_DN19966_c0_g1_i3:81-1412(+)
MTATEDPSCQQASHPGAHGGHLSQKTSGSGTGVMKAYHAGFMIRGITTGVVSSAALFIARESGVPQSLLVTARGIGLTLGPMLVAGLVSRGVRAGESQTLFGAALLVKMAIELLISVVRSSWGLYSSFLLLGLAMAVLDTLASILVVKVHGKQCALPLLIYCGLYGVGNMAAPYVTILALDNAWYVLAAIDFTVGSTILFKRIVYGKPRDWKAKVRGAEVVALAAEGERIAEATTYAPPRIVRAGLAFVFIGEMADTAVSCWAFTFASVTLGLSNMVSAMFPSVFYLFFTLGRFVVAPLCSRVPPSALLQGGVVLFLGSSIMFNALVWMIQSSSALSEDPVYLEALCSKGLLVCMAMIGFSACPFYCMMLAALRQHGELTPKDAGYYNTAACLGCTAGMCLPGIFGLPCVEMCGAIAMCFIMSSHTREFPWRKEVLEENKFSA